MITSCFVLLAFYGNTLFVQSLSVFADSTGTNYNITANIGVPTTAYVLYLPGGPITEITGAELQVGGCSASLRTRSLQLRILLQILI